MLDRVLGMRARAQPPRLYPALLWLIVCIGLGLAASPSFAQTSPELAMRDFSSGQIKKGVRSIPSGLIVAPIANVAWVVGASAGGLWAVLRRLERSLEGDFQNPTPVGVHDVGTTL